MHNLNKFSILLLFIIIALSHFAKAQDYNTETYNDISEKSQYFVNDGSTLGGSILLRLFVQIDGTGCHEPNLHLKLLHKDGTSSSLEVENFSVSSTNFCTNTNDTYDSDQISFDAIGDDLYISYYNNSDSNPNATYGQIVLRVNLEGKIISESYLGDVINVDNVISHSWISIRDTSFLYIIEYANDFLWNKYDYTDDGLKLSQEGIASKKELPLDRVNFAAFFGEFYSGFGYLYTIPQNNTATDSLNPSLNIYVRFFKPEIDKFTKPFVIYQTIANVTVTSADCGPDFIRVEFKCLITFQRNTATSSINNYLLISFLSSGFVISVEEIPTDNVNDQPFFFDLPYGGYLLAYFNRLENGCTIGGQLLDNNNVLRSTLNFPNLVVPYPCNIFLDTSENKAHIASDTSLNSITMITSNLPKFIDDGRSSDMISANIKSTSPSFNTTIDLGMNSLEIDYSVTVLPSIQNITIYQVVDGNETIMRQTMTGISDLCFVDPDHQKMSLKVLSSAFNIPNSEYHISIDTNFVKQNETGEPIFGLKSSIWILYTGSKADPFADSFPGSIRLTPEGTTNFKNLSDSDQSEFINQLIQEISSIVPVDIDRLKITKPYQIDLSTPSEQLIIPLQIKNTRDTSKRNANILHQDLDIMIQNRDFTGISTHYYTSFLDASYGYQLRADISKMVQDNKMYMTILLIMFIALCGLSLWAKKNANKKKDEDDENGDHFIIFKLGLSILDFVLDGLFVYYNAPDLPNIYTISLVFFVVPTGLNFIVAVSLIIYENIRNTQFSEWFRMNTAVASVITILGATNIEMLNVLTSKFGGLYIFSAKFSGRTKSLLHWFGLLNFFIEDVPQFAIQIYYKRHVVSYDFIPFLTLITSSLGIALNITGRIYTLVSIKLSKKVKNKNENSNENKNVSSTNETGVNIAEEGVEK